MHKGYSVARGQKVLQVHGFPTQTYGETLILILRCESKFCSIKFPGVIHSACSCEQFVMNSFPESQTLNFSLRSYAKTALIGSNFRFEQLYSSIWMTAWWNNACTKTFVAT